MGPVSSPHAKNSRNITTVAWKTLGLPRPCAHAKSRAFGLRGPMETPLTPVSSRDVFRAFFMSYSRSESMVVAIIWLADVTLRWNVGGSVNHPYSQEPRLLR